MSELLIALAIIGIISAVTVPTLVARYQRQSYTLALQKTYNEFAQAIDLFIINEYIPNIYKSSLSTKDEAPSDANIPKTAGKFLKNYFKIAQDCGLDTTPCFASEYKNLNLEVKTFSCNYGYTITLQNGSAVCLVPARSDSAAIVYVDTNGPDKPNIGGRDLFSFQIYKDGSIDESVPPSFKSSSNTGNPKDKREEKYTELCKTSVYGAGCFGKILNSNWKMDY